jgi:hypothetical protein
VEVLKERGIRGKKFVSAWVWPNDAFESSAVKVLNGRV